MPGIFDSDFVTVLRRKWNKGINHHAHVYISRKDETAIVVTLHFNGEGGILFEDSSPVLLLPPFDALDLGRKLSAALSRTQVHSPVSFAKRKLTDWPAFRASKAKSVRHFEEEYIGILVAGANESNLVYIIDGSPEKDAELHVVANVSSSAPPTELGDLIRRVYSACRDRQV